MPLCTFRSKTMLLWIMLLLMLAACAGTPERIHPEFQDRIPPLKTLYVMPPDALVFQAGPPGTVHPDAELSGAIGNRIVDQVAEQFRLKEYRVRVFSLETDRREIGDLMTLYRAVNKSIQLHTYGPSLFPEKCRQFDYSVGAVDSFLKRKAADGLLFTRVRDRNTPGRYRTYVSLAVADGSGDILWYSAGGTKSASEQRRGDPTRKLVRSLVRSFPEARR